MSQARVYSVKKTRKDQGKCGKCGVEIKEGDPYIYFSPGFRTRKRIRCTKPECYPTRSDRETNANRADFYATVDGLDITGIDSLDAAQQAVDEVREKAEEIRDSYEEALEAWPNGNSQIEELRDEWENIVSELESWAPEDQPDECEDHNTDDPHDDCEACNAFDQWQADLQSSVEDAVNAL